MTTTRPQRIAIVEDEFPTAQLLLDVVEDIGHVVGDAVYYRPPGPGDGFWRKPPDLVLCDVYFAGVPKGIDFCRALATRSIPFFLFSAGETTDLVGLLGELQPLGLIHKPLRAREIFSRIELALQHRPPPQSAITPTTPTITLRDRGIKVEVPLADISYVESNRNHCIIHAGDRRYVALRSLKGLLAEHAETPLVQIHRSYLVNPGHVRGHNAREVVLEDGTRLPIGRKYRSGLDGGTRSTGENELIPVR